MWAYHGAALQELKEWRAALASSTNDKLRILRAIGQVLLDTTIDNAADRAVSFTRVPEAVLRAAVDETAGLIRPRQDDAPDRRAPTPLPIALPSASPGGAPGAPH